MQPSLITLNDAITDSPVYRANVHHFDEQLELLEKWLDALSKHLKLYCDKLNKFNLETNLVCKKAIPVGIDNSLIDPHFTGAVIKSFSDALQTSLAFKTKLVSDLEDNFIQPLQQFVRVQLKDFKDFRKQHEKALERYEAQLTKYSSQSKFKEVSALREEAFRLHEARKYYVHMSGQHVVRILQFRSSLEHTLVEQFSAATLAHLNDFDGGMHVWQKLDNHLASWKQWLVDDKSTCNYQLHKLQNTRKELENEFINQTQPPRDLDKYAPSAINTVLQSPMANRFSVDFLEKATPDQHHKAHHKWGYLFTRGARGYWTRRWFFLFDGYFGSCLVNASPKLKGAVSLDERVSVLLSEIKPILDIDRRYCFEVVCAQKSPIVMQAETEDEMKDWIAAFDKAKRLAIHNEQVPAHVVSSPTTDERSGSIKTEHNVGHEHVSSTRSFSHVDASKSFITETSHDQLSTSPTRTDQQHDTQPTIVLLSTSADNDRVSLANSTSLTPLLVWEAARAPSAQPGSTPFATTTTSIAITSATTTTTTTTATSASITATTVAATTVGNSSSSSSSPPPPPLPALSNKDSYASDIHTHRDNDNQLHDMKRSNGDNSKLVSRRPLNLTLPTPKSTSTNPSNTSWGIPWTLVPSMFQSSGDSTEPPPTPSNVPPSPMFGECDGHQVIWPANLEDSHVPRIDLNDYSAELEQRNKELRSLFGGVAPHEVVLDAFICSLKKPPNASSKDMNTSKDDDDLDWPTSPIGSGSPLEQMEQELQIQLTQSVKPPTSEFGYSYTGRAFVTQETFWLYSCVVMTCVHTVAVRLKDITNIRLVRDPSITNIGKQSNIALAIDLKQDDVSPRREPLILVTLMDDIEVVAEKLRIAVDNAKSTEPSPLQTMYDILHHMSAAMSKKKNASVTTIIKSEPTKAQSSPDLIRRQRSNSNGDIHGLEPASSPIPSSSASSRLERMRKRKGGKNSASSDSKHQPKSGALAAAMMAATVAGGGSFFDVSKMNRPEDESDTNSNTQKQLSEKHNISVLSDMNDKPDKATAGKASSAEQQTKHDSDSTSTATDELPPHIQAPQGPIACGCNDHLERMEYEVDVPISAKRLYDLLFSEEKAGVTANGGIWDQKTTASGSRELNVSAWSDVDGKQQRILKYIMPVNNPMIKVKEAEVVETQVTLKKQDYLRYVVQISTKSAQLPYADAFIPSIRYCISWVAPSQSHLSICIGIKFVKNILVKSMVMKAALKGMSESITQFTPMIMEHANKLNGGSRKTMTDGLNHGAQGQLNENNTTDNSATASSSTGTKPFDVKNNKDEGWYGHLMDILEMIQDIIPFPIGTVLIGLIVLWISWAWLRSGTTRPHGLYPTSMDHQVISRAIYLRDVEEGLLNSTQQASYMDPHCYQLFLQSKADIINRNLTNTMDHWYSPKHYTFSVELLFSRERLAILRHDTLVIFRLLNQVDAQLSENEYVNWLLDAKLECHAGVTLSNAGKCEAVHHQLQSLISFSSSSSNTQV